MAVQPDTATAVPPVIVGNAKTFTAGDPQQGIAPTQVSPTFLNALCREINVAIQVVGENADGVERALDFAATQQLAYAILDRIATQHNYDTTNAPWSRRTYKSSGTDVDRNWRTWFRNSSRVGVADNTVQTSGHVVMPDNSQFWVTFEVNVVRTTSITVWKSVILRANCRRNGGAVTVGTVTVVDSAGGLGATFDLVATSFNGEPAVAVQTTLPGPGGALFNIAVSATASNVTTGT